MIDDHDVAHLTAFINERIARQSEELMSGRAASFDDYKRRVGFIAGLRESITVIEAYAKRLEAMENGIMF